MQSTRHCENQLPQNIRTTPQKRRLSFMCRSFMAFLHGSPSAVGSCPRVTLHCGCGECLMLSSSMAVCPTPENESSVCLASVTEEGQNQPRTRSGFQLHPPSLVSAGKERRAKRSPAPSLLCAPALWRGERRRGGSSALGEASAARPLENTGPSSGKSPPHRVGSCNVPPPKKAAQMQRCTKEWRTIGRSGTQSLVLKAPWQIVSLTC
eukprot:3357862-Amphidinium_carterae.1